MVISIGIQLMPLAESVFRCIERRSTNLLRVDRVMVGLEGHVCIVHIPLDDGSQLSFMLVFGFTN